MKSAGQSSKCNERATLVAGCSCPRSSISATDRIMSAVEELEHTLWVTFDRRKKHSRAGAKER